MGVGGRKDEGSDIDLVFYIGKSQPEYKNRYLELLERTYPRFKEAMKHDNSEKQEMINTGLSIIQRIWALEKTTEFRNTFGRDLDFSIVPIADLSTHLQTINNKIRKNHGAKSRITLTEDEFWATYLTANFFGSPQIFESNTEQDKHFGNKLKNVFFDSPQGKEHWNYGIRQVFDVQIVDYEYYSWYREGLLKNKERVENAFEQILEREHIHPQEKQRVINFLRQRRAHIRLPSYEELKQTR